jgi:phosphatidate phosphatase APP1
MPKFRVLYIALAALAATSAVRAQSISATLTGLVSDASEAVVPNAKVTVTNSTSGDVRRSITNADGYFTFASLPAGTYKVTVEAAVLFPMR